MSDVFARISDADLDGLIAGLRSGRVCPPYPNLQIARVIPSPLLSGIVREEISQLALLEFSPEQIAKVLELIKKNRINDCNDRFPFDLVTSGPEAPGITNRETSVVVRELFSHAKDSVLVVGYAVHQGQQVFQSLAFRMKEIPNLKVQFFLNIPRPEGDMTPSEILIARFKQRFKDNQWPVDCPLPEVFYDPRSISYEQPVRSSLHAKCVVVDSEQVFISSANFTEAGQNRNVEVGLSIKNRWLANQVIRHFTLLSEHNLALRAF